MVGNHRQTCYRRRMDDMLQPRNRHLVRKRHAGQLCTCSECGQVVWPYPLPLSPAMRLVRGYPKSRARLDIRTRALRFDPMLWCISCAPLIVVQWWTRWEEAAAELLQNLPSIATDVKMPDESESFTDELPRVGADDDSSLHNCVVLS